MSLQCQHSVNPESYCFVLHPAPSNIKGSGLSWIDRTSGLFTEIPAVHGEAGLDDLAEDQNASEAFASIQVTRPDFSECLTLWWPLEYALMFIAPR